MGPDDEFSLICFRPISEKTRTTSRWRFPPFGRLPKGDPEDLSCRRNEPRELLATITPTTLRDLQRYAPAASIVSISNE